LKRYGEFTSKQFGEFCHDKGINTHFTAAYIAQQNGVAEKKRTIRNMVASI